MAEAAVQEQPVNKCYCHQCKTEITPKLPDYTCPSCSGGFIEDLGEVLVGAVEDEGPGSDEPLSSDPMAQRFSNMWGHQFLRNFMDHSGQETQSNSSSSSTEGDEHHHLTGHQGNPVGINFQFITPGRTISLGPLGRGRGGGAGAGNVGVNPLQSLLEPILLGLTGQGRGGTFVFGAPGGGIHGNLGDYAWGEGGLDSIITQLMNQLEGTGPPPASDENIDSLPFVEIEGEHVDQRLQCNICFEDYILREKVIKLPCQHVYHKECITPWLKQHGTCPVCRKNLDGKDTTCDENVNSIPDVLTNFGLSNNDTRGGAARPTPGVSGSVGVRPDPNLANSVANTVDPSAYMDDVSIDGDDEIEIVDDQ